MGCKCKESFGLAGGERLGYSIAPAIDRHFISRPGRTGTWPDICLQNCNSTCRRENQIKGHG